MSQIRTRFAPSPTGPIHIGNIRTALFNYLYTKSQKDAIFALRIEDTDLARSTKEYERLIFNELQWLGIEWDEGPDKGGPYAPYRQSERLEVYHKYAQRLIDEGKAYYCYCTPEELEEDKKKSLETSDVPKYSGKCRHLSREQKALYDNEGRKSTIRFIVEEDKNIVFDDLVKGSIEMNSSILGGDLVIFKADGMPTYNFAVVIDDYEMGITNVIRGEDHLSNTPKQILIYEALGLNIPRFGHAPLILGPDRTKLSKRHGNTYIGQYRDAGYLPETMFNFLALLSWSPEGEQVIMSKDEILGQFKIERVTKGNPVFDIDKLNWMNGQYIRNSAIERITELSIPYLIKAGYITQEDAVNRYEWIKMMVATLRDGMTTLSEVTERAEVFFNNKIVIEEGEAQEVMKGEGVSQLLDILKQKTQQLSEVNEESIKAMFKEIQKETGIKGKGLFMPTRIAISGQCHGPDLVNSLILLGRDEIIKRVEYVKNNI